MPLIIDYSSRLHHNLNNLNEQEGSQYSAERLSAEDEVGRRHLHDSLAGTIWCTAGVIEIPSSVSESLASY